jgi:hypothetical protein
MARRLAQNYVESDPQTVPAVTTPDTCADYVAFGQYSDYRGFQYEQKYEFYRICAAGVFEDSTYFAYPTNPLKYFNKLSDAKYQRVKNFVNYLPAQLLNDTTKSYGNLGYCQIYYIISIREKSGTKTFYIDGNDSLTPAFLHPIVDTMQLYTQILQ